MTPAALNVYGVVTGSMTRDDGIRAPFLYDGAGVYDLSGLSSLLIGGVPIGINDYGQIAINAANSYTIYLLTPYLPQATAPTGVSPASGSGASQTMTFTFNDTRGWNGISVVNILINSVLDGRRACYLAFVPASASSGSVFLVDDAGDAGGPYQGLVLPGNGTAGNSQCSMQAAGSSVSASGTQLTLSLSLNFSQSFAGNKQVYLSLGDAELGNTGWQALGTWNVPGR